MIDYVLVYDASQSPVTTADDFVFPLLAAGATILYLTRRRWIRTWVEKPDWYERPSLLLGITILFWLITLGTWSGVSDEAALGERVHRGAYELVEGTVENFVPGDRGAHHEESWTIRSGGAVHAYRYLVSRDEPGFRQSAGPVYAGARVRVADVDGVIGRLEIEPREVAHARALAEAARR